MKGSTQWAVASGVADGRNERQWAVGRENPGDGRSFINLKAREPFTIHD